MKVRPIFWDLDGHQMRRGFVIYLQTPHNLLWICGMPWRSVSTKTREEFEKDYLEWKAKNAG